MRERLPDRRHSDVVRVVHRLRGGAQPYTATIGYYPDGRIGEVFIDAAKDSNDGANLARDVAVLISLALQHGVPIEEMRAAMGRGEDSQPHSVAGAVLDALAHEAMLAKKAPP